MTASNCKTEPHIEMATAEHRVPATLTPLEQIQLEQVPLEQVSLPTREQQDPNMAIRVVLVPAGQSAPPASHVLVRIQCRRQLAPWAQLQMEEAQHGQLTLPLTLLAEQDYDELWLVDEAVESHQLGAVQIRRSGHYQFCWLWFSPLSQPTLASSASGARSSNYSTNSRWAYEQLLASQLADKRLRQLQKIWHYLPAINQGEGDQENYRQFCQGREHALNASRHGLHPLPAATAIGIPDPQAPALFYWLSAHETGTNIENPRQLQAWRYPRQYGPARPNFSRGTLSAACGQFLISGTASVVGHATAHPHDTVSQAQEMLNNLRSLLDQALPTTLTPALAEPSSIKLSGPLRLYLRHPEEVTLVRQQCARAGLADAQLLAYCGDICRTDLTVEMDGLHQF